MFTFLRDIGRLFCGPALTSAGICVLALMAVLPSDVRAGTVGLICDGHFHVQLGGVDTVTENRFGGVIHLALVERDGDFVEVRIAGFEEETPMQEQVFALPEAAMVEPSEMASASMLGQMSGSLILDDSVGVIVDDDQEPGQQGDSVISITASAESIELSQMLESGPMMRARVDGMPLVQTRESIATVDLMLDRITGDLKLVWTDNRVRNHKLRGAIRASRIQLRDEKTYEGRCFPVTQKTF